MKLQIRPALKSYYLCLSPLQILEKADYTWHLQPPRQSLQGVFFKTIPLNFVVNFDTIGKILVSSSLLDALKPYSQGEI